MPVQKKPPVRRLPAPPKAGSFGWRFAFWRRRASGAVVCAWVRAALRVRRAMGRLWAKLKLRPEAGRLGDFLYSVGFASEYFTLRALRAARVVSAAVLRRLKGILGVVGRFVGGMLGTVWTDITQPFVRIGIGLHNLRTFVRQQRRLVGGGRAVGGGVAYFFRGIRRYFPLVGRAFTYVLPVLALGVFGYTVKTVLAYNYVLAVSVNGSLVGYVENETVFDRARDAVAERVETAGSEHEQWSVNPSYNLAISDFTMDQNTMADAILRSSSDEIIEASAMYVDGELQAITTEGDRLRGELDNMLEPYRDHEDPDQRVEFVQDVELVDGVFFTDSITEYNSIDSMLHGQVQGEVYDTVQEGDSPSGMAARNDLTLAQFYEMNGGEAEVNSRMFPGQQFLIRQSVDFLNVKTIVRRTYQEEIPFQTNTTESGDYAWGTTRTVQEGVNGLDEVTSDFITIGGVTSEQEISRVTLSAPVTREIVKGTKLPTGAVVATATGSWMWPVPQYRYVSRWMSSYHKGADICAPYGSAILASDNGVVTTAGYHYSYGNYVVINHGNGWTTLYAHASALHVSVGQYVEQGQIIASVGSTGNSSGNHCHFEMYDNGVRVSARNFFGGM